MTTIFKDAGTSFAEHDKYRRDFRRGHGKVALASLPESRRPFLLDATRPVSVRQLNIGLGRLSMPVNTSGFRSSIPIHRVAAYKLSAN